MLLLHAVLLIFGTSLLALALRSLFLINCLISTALVLFALGVVGLVSGITCILIDLAQGDSGSDTLGYSLATVLFEIAGNFSRQWQRRRSQLVDKPLASRAISDK